MSASTTSQDTYTPIPTLSSCLNNVFWGDITQKTALQALYSGQTPDDPKIAVYQGSSEPCKIPTIWCGEIEGACGSYLVANPYQAGVEMNPAGFGLKDGQIVRVVSVFTECDSDEEGKPMPLAEQAKRLDEFEEETGLHFALAVLSGDTREESVDRVFTVADTSDLDLGDVEVSSDTRADWTIKAGKSIHMHLAVTWADAHDEAQAALRQRAADVLCAIFWADPQVRDVARKSRMPSAIARNGWEMRIQTTLRVVPDAARSLEQVVDVLDTYCKKHRINVEKTVEAVKAVGLCLIRAHHRDEAVAKGVYPDGFDANRCRDEAAQLRRLAKRIRAEGKVSKEIQGEMDALRSFRASPKREVDGTISRSVVASPKVRDEIPEYVETRDGQVVARADLGTAIEARGGKLLVVCPDGLEHMDNAWSAWGYVSNAGNVCITCSSCGTTYRMPKAVKVKTAGAAGTAPETVEPVFQVGDEVEVGLRLLTDLGAVDATGTPTGAYLVTEGGTWYSARPDGIWEDAPTAPLHVRVQGYSGLPVAYGDDETHPLRVGDRMARGVINCAAARLDDPRAFGGEVVPALGTATAVFKDGTVVCADGSVRKVRREDRLRVTDALQVRYDGYAPCPRWERFLQEVWEGTPDLKERIAYLQEVMGAAVFGVGTVKGSVPILFGGGENGKSKLLGVVESLFHATARTAIPPQSLASEYHRAHLARSRLNIVSEMPEREIVASEPFKAAVTGDLMSGRFPAGRPFDFRPRATWIIACNRLPQTKDTTHGFMRRPVILTFPNVFGPDRADPDLAEKLVSELPGIARWAVEGGLRLIRTGRYTVPPTSRDEATIMAADANPVLRFIAEHLRASDGPGIQARKLYNVYREWAIGGGHGAVSDTKLGRELAERFKREKEGTIRWMVEIVNDWRVTVDPVVEEFFDGDNVVPFPTPKPTPSSLVAAVVEEALAVVTDAETLSDLRELLTSIRAGDLAMLRDYVGIAVEPDRAMRMGVSVATRTPLWRVAEMLTMGSGAA